MPRTVVCTCPDVSRKREANPYEIFDLTLLNESKTILDAEDILNRRSACANLPIGFLGDNTHDSATYRDILREWDNSIGLYHIWAHDGLFCEKHKTCALKCLYVGKGEAYLRIIDEHINKKIDDFGCSAIYVSFFHCRNRFAKYYERLFLDIFKIKLNRKESKGEIELWAYWPTERLQFGTDAHNNADRYAKKIEGIRRK